MSNGTLPQWKRELLQRRAARARPPLAPVPPAPPPPVPPAADDDEELRYGPGIVKRLKSRYLSLALREAPRRRPSVLRRAASLEHLLDERPPPAPRQHARPARPVSMAVPSSGPHSAPVPRRESVKRARSVDALSRLDSRDESPHVQLQSSLQPPPRPPPPPPSPPPLTPRATRPPRRPAPLLREAERPPADLVRSTLRKFESAPPRRTAPAARVSAVLRGLESLPRSSTPEPRGRSPSPAATDLSAIDEPETSTTPAPSETKQVSKRALESIARAGSSVLYSFTSGGTGSHLPPLAACNTVLVGRARRVGVIRPMPAQTLEPAEDETDDKPEDVRIVISPPPLEDDSQNKERTTSAPHDPRPTTPTEESVPTTPYPAVAQDADDARPAPAPQTETPKIPPLKPTINGHATSAKSDESKVDRSFSKIGAAGIERAWTGDLEKKQKGDGEVKSPWGATRAPRPPAPAATSVVFNFSNRKEVPDYVENDGTIRRVNRRNIFKAGEAGIVVLRPEALEAGSESEEELRPSSPPSPVSVKFVNDNVLMNGRSSIASRPPNLSRTLKLKLQFDDSLTRTFEYPSETSLAEDGTAAPATPAAPSSPGTLAANTHIVSASLCGYTPSKTCADTFVLGLAPRRAAEEHQEPTRSEALQNGSAACGDEDDERSEDVRPCGASDARAWSEARTHTDLLF
ncbi:ras-associated and pleckstrin homology domains-containing protein 1 isoform X2 [Danaus plexippus]|nr:ras-associated and pleckstrin homology domains-containing protein 1 isoform X2 [Danaus plexippus]